MKRKQKQHIKRLARNIILTIAALGVVFCVGYITGYASQQPCKQEQNQ